MQFMLKNTVSKQY